MNAISPLALNIPSVGQPGVERGWWVTSIFECQCKTPGPLVILAGIGNPSMCPNCGRTYILQGLVADPTGDIRTVVASKKAQPQPEV